jgi:DNA-binding NtrC family response regulator
MPPVVLVTSDHRVARRRLRDELDARGFLTVESESGDAAWERFRKELPDLVVMDVRLSLTEGVELVRRIRRTARSWVPILVVTGDTDLDVLKVAVQATKEGATEVLHFRRDLDRLGETAERLCALSVAGMRREKRLRAMQTIQSLLPECEGNLSKLARLAEIPRSTLYLLLREMGLLEEKTGARPPE